MKSISNRLPLLLMSGLAIAGCTSTDPGRVENDFGESVRQMIDAQLYNPEAAVDPSLIGVDTLDGTSAAIAIDNYRKRSQRGDLPAIDRSMVSP